MLLTDRTSKSSSPKAKRPAERFHRSHDGPDFRVMCAHIGRRYIANAPLLKKAWLVLGSDAVQSAMEAVKPGETFKATSIVQHYAAAIEEAPLSHRTSPISNSDGSRSPSRSSVAQAESIQQFFDRLVSSQDGDGTNQIRVESKYFGVSVEITANVAEIHKSLVVLRVPDGRAKVLTKCTAAILHFDDRDMAFAGELAAVDLDTNMVYLEKVAMCAQGTRSIDSAGGSEESPIESRVSGPGFEFTGRLEDVTLDTLTIFFGHVEPAKLAEANELKVSVFLPNYDDAGVTEISPSVPTIKSIQPRMDDGGIRLDVDIQTDEELLNNLLVWLGRKNPLF